MRKRAKARTLAFCQNEEEEKEDGSRGREQDGRIDKSSRRSHRSSLRLPSRVLHRGENEKDEGIFKILLMTLTRLLKLIASIRYRFDSRQIGLSVERFDQRVPF